eukprot:scaffold659015_cov45-Prasinocladus_malaysianus.AAC.1
MSCDDFAVLPPGRRLVPSREIHMLPPPQQRYTALTGEGSGVVKMVSVLVSSDDLCPGSHASWSRGRTLDK